MCLLQWFQTAPRDEDVEAINEHVATVLSHRASGSLQLSSSPSLRRSSSPTAKVKSSAQTGDGDGDSNVRDGAHQPRSSDGVTVSLERLSLQEDASLALTPHSEVPHGEVSNGTTTHPFGATVSTAGSVRTQPDDEEKEAEEEEAGGGGDGACDTAAGVERDIVHSAKGDDAVNTQQEPPSRDSLTDNPGD